MSCDPGPKPAVRLTGVKKAYRLYDRGHHRLLQAIAGARRRYYRSHTALDGIDLTIGVGETVGVIGANGAGKSTLLGVVTGTITPDEGQVAVSGRVAPMLELGAGFHPDFTGAENIRLAARVLGLAQAEIDARFDAIVEFSGIAAHMDQPVKHYSSGMYARLAFAVAAHVDASILVIDELLSVGDAGFAQKCFRFLEGFRQQGTVVFVSHDLGAVHRFCDRVIWLHRGRIHAQGPPKPVCDAYLGFMFQGGGEPKPVPQVRAPDPGTDRLGRPGAVVAQDPRHGQMDNPIRIGGFGAGASAFGEGGARVTDVALLGPDGGALDAVRGGETVTVRVTATAKTRLEAPILGFYLRDRTGQNLFGDNTYLTLLDKRLPLAPGQSVTALFTFQMPYLARGEYSLSVAIADGSELAHTQHHWIDDAVRITVPASHFAHGLVGIPMQDVSVSVDGDPVVGAA